MDKNKVSLFQKKLIFWNKNTNVAEFFSSNYPELKGFNRRGLYRMKQFYDLYNDYEKVSTLLTQLSWSNHLKIMSGSKSKEEREFYIIGD